MNEEFELTVEDLSTITEYMRGDNPDKPVKVDLEYLKDVFMLPSRLICLQMILKARCESIKGRDE